MCKYTMLMSEQVLSRDWPDDKEPTYCDIADMLLAGMPNIINDKETLELKWKAIVKLLLGGISNMELEQRAKFAQEKLDSGNDLTWDEATAIVLWEYREIWERLAKL